jgi:hypothetical protein
MLIDQEARTFESNTVNGKSAFTIAASSKAFQILSNQLYTDKPRAILRELSTNALDAHIDAGKADVPFEVQLPTTWDSTLVVKDFGTGMSPEQIKHLYCTYFGSDKTHTNDLVGGLGLGSKSPFAYTDQFTAISRYDGIKYTYAAFIGAANVPEISLVGQEDTDEGNGFEVHVPVKENDIYTFERTAKRVFEFFDVKPILNQSIDFTIYDEPVMTMIYDGVECSLYTEQDATMVMQGPIGYPVDSYAIMSELEYNKRSKVEAFFQKGWRIKAPVGSFEITASREALSYDEITIAKLLETAHGVLKKVQAEAELKLLDAETMKEAADLIIASSKYLSSAYTLKDTTWNGMNWNGSGFEVDLPPDTKCREIRKRQYGRGADPHQTDIHDRDVMVLGTYNYRVYWSETDRPFKGYIGQNPVTDKSERILYFTGPAGNIRSWLESVGLPAGEEMPKPDKSLSANVRKVNYGATKYRGVCLTTGNPLEATANDIIDEQNAYVMLTAHGNGPYVRQQEFEIFESLEVLDLPDEEVYVFYVPDHHSKVTKAIQAHPGFINRELLFDLVCKPLADVQRKIALAEALTESYNSITKYATLEQVVDSKLIEAQGIIDLIQKVDAVQDAQRGNHNIYTIKNHLEVYKLGLDKPPYTDLVNKFVKGQTHELRTLWDEFKPVLELAIKGHSECGHWRYKDSSLRTIVTQWVNTEVALLSTALTQEVA